MLSSADADGDAARSRHLGIARYLRKPASPSELHEAVLHVLGETPTMKPNPRKSTTDSMRNKLTILLAEDNVINQKVAVSILEKRGHEVQTVGNGREALQALACERFDVVLMDVQMPEMDGLEATAAIREMEKGTGRRIPIVAMTAHAMKGDRERCLGAGMDDYVSKPVEPKSLNAVIEQWGSLGRHNRTASEQVPSQKPHAIAPRTKKPGPMTTTSENPTLEKEVFDLAALRERVENDLELLDEMIELYLSSSPLLLAELETAIKSRDREKLSRSAHTLKGVLKNMCANACAEAALQLEMTGKSGDIERADESLVALKNEFQRLESALTTVSKGIGA
jgi:CheY-like chemotaxis protein